MTGWLSEIRFGLRLLRRSPEVTVVAVLATAIAIGVAGTVFSVANEVLIQPLLACYLPARRAAKVDPMIALRRE